MNKDDARRWLSYAKSDLQACQALMNDPEHFPRQVCYLAQQAAEKSFKAILVLLEIEYPFTHDLDRLRELVPTGWHVKESFPKLYGLSIWAVETRYPGDLPDVVESDAQEALNTASAIYTTIMDDFTHLLESS